MANAFNSVTLPSLKTDYEKDYTESEIRKMAFDLLAKLNETYSFASDQASSKTAVTHEYVSNSSATNADDTTSFVTGTTGEGNGAAGGGSVGILRTTALTAQRKKRIQFANAIKAGDLIQIELWDGVAWVAQQYAAVYAFNALGTIPILTSDDGLGAANFGMGLLTVSGTTMDVVFGKLISSNFVTTQTDWNNTGIAVGTQWRVHKISFS